MGKTKNGRLRLLLLASYANNLGWGIYAPLYALFILKLGGTTFEISMLWSLYALIAGVLMMLFGKLENSRKYNPAFMLVVGYSLFIMVAVAYLSAKSISQFYIAQLVLAVAMGILTPAARITYARAQKKGAEAGEWGLFDGGNYILIAIAALLGGVIYKFGGFRAIFVAMILIQTVATLLALRYNRLHR